MSRATLTLCALALLGVGGARAAGVEVGRHLTQEASAVAPAPETAPVPLPLPEDPSTACSADVLRAATAGDNDCPETMGNYNGVASETCCAALAKVYGVNATDSASRNCFCVADYYNWLVAALQEAYLPFPSPYLAGCNALGFDIAFYQDGAGPCAGIATVEETPTEPEGPSPPPPPLLKQRTFSEWVSRLRYDSWVALFFVTSIFAGIGCLVLIWAWIFDGMLSSYETIAAFVAKKRQ